MRITIDVSSLLYGTGVSVYTKNLVENLLLIDTDNSYFLFAGSLRRYKEMLKLARQFSGSYKSKVVPLPPALLNIVWNRLHKYSIEKFVGKTDVFHSSDWTQPPSDSFKVTTIHDLVPIKYPEMSDPKIVSVHKSRLRWVIKEVDRIIVPSHTTSEDLIKLGADKDRIRVIAEASDKKIRPAKKIEIEYIKRKHRISGKYLLAVGVNPRKNTESIVRAFEKIKPYLDLKLVILGHNYMKADHTRGVMLLGHVPQSELSAFYSGAEALVYPSLYEGFGLPILEAFNTKTPVVTSNYGSMAEIAADAAVLVDPYDVNSIAEGVLRVIKDKEKLVKLGSARAQQFSWKKTAEETLKVYQESGK